MTYIDEIFERLDIQHMREYFVFFTAAGFDNIALSLANAISTTKAKINATCTKNK